MKRSNTTSGSDNGFCGLLFLLFLGLRLAGVIDWPWIWVFAPLWIPLVALVAAFSIFALCDRFNK